MILNSRYEYNPATDLLGRGGFARVYKARDLNLDIDVAVKIFNITGSETGKYTVYEEIKRGIKWNHTNLLRYFDATVLENTNSVGEKEIIQVGIMELANGGDLKQFSRLHPGSRELVELLKQVLSGLDYLHQRQVIHRDLKPQNILLVESHGVYTAKISDFGISKALDSGSVSTSKAIGTIEYMAPEQFSPEKYAKNGIIGTNLDLWSFGVMVYELIANEPLYGKRNGDSSAEQIMSSIMAPELPASVHQLPEPFRTVVKKCLVHDAAKRTQRAAELFPLFDTFSGLSFDSLDEAPITREIPVLEKKQEPVMPEPAVSEPASPETTLEELPTEKSKKGIVIVVMVTLIATLGIYFYSKLATKNPQDIYQQAEDSFKLGDYDKVLSLLKDESSNTLEDTLQMKILSLKGKCMLIKRDSARALPYLKKAAWMGDTNSCFELGWIFYRGKYQTREMDSIVHYLKLAAQKNDSRAEAQLGYMYLVGDGIAADPNEAMKHYFAASKLGNSVAKLGLGLMYMAGMGAKQDKEEAKHYFEEVIRINDNPKAVADAQKYLTQL